MLSDVTTTLDAFVAFVTVAETMEHVSVDVFGLYVNGVVVLSTYRVEFEATVLENGTKYDPAVLSLVKDIELDEDEFPDRDPENVVAVTVFVEGLQLIPVVF